MNLTLVKLRNLASSWFPKPLQLIERWRFAFVHLRRFNSSGWSLPMPYLLKRSMLIRFAQLSNSRQFVETGTYLGDTPWHLRHLFDHLWTIELHPTLAQLAADRFSKIPNVTVQQGDSTDQLPNIIPKLTHSTLFWLDGHYCGPQTGHGEKACPIFPELDSLFHGCSLPFVACIDDARLFGQELGYPTLEELDSFLETQCGSPKRWIENDIIFVVPQTHPLYSSLSKTPFESIRSIF